MGRNGTAPQEGRSEKVAVAVTPTQRRAIVGLAALRGTDMSNLLHELSVNGIVEEWERVAAAAETRPVGV